MNRFQVGAKVFASGVKKNGRKIALAGQLLSLVATAITTWNARPKVDKILEETKERRHSEDKDTRTSANIEAAKKIALAMIPTAMSMSTGAASSICGYRIASREIGDAVSAANNAMAMANLATKEKMELEEAMKKTLDEDQIKAVEEKKDEIQKEADRPVLSASQYGVIVKPGDVLCRDYYTGGYFSSNRSKLDLVERQLCDILTDGDPAIVKSMQTGEDDSFYDNYVLVSDYHSLIGLDTNGFGKEYGYTRKKLRKFNHGDTIRIRTAPEKDYNDIPYLEVMLDPAPWKIDEDTD